MHRQSAFQIKTTKVMQEDLATILIKVWINFSTKFIVISTLFDTVQAILRLKSSSSIHFDIQMKAIQLLPLIKTNVNTSLTDTDNLEKSDSF